MIAHDRTQMVGSLLLAALLAGPALADAGKPRVVGKHAGGIASTDFSPDGKWLASAGGDQKVRIWDVAAGRLLHECQGPTSFTCAVRFSPDGKTLAAGGYESGPGNAIYLIDVATGKESGRLDGHPTGGIRRLAFTPDGKRLLSGGFDGVIRVWDLQTRKELRAIKAEAGTVYGIALSPDARTVATAGRDGLRLWEVDTGKELLRGAMNKAGCVAVAFSPDGKVIAGGETACVRLWEAATGKEIAALTGYKGELSGLVFSGDGRILYTASYDKAVRLWEVRTGRLIHEAEAHTGWVWGIALSPDEKRLASCSVDTKLLLWDLVGLGRRSVKPAQLSDRQRAAHVDDLASGDAATAYRAVCALAGDPAGSLPVLEKRLTASPTRGPSAADVARMIRDLDADEFPVREKASANLEKAGSPAVPALRRTLANPPSLEVRRRIERLLVRLDPTEMPAEELVALRGVQTLEYMATPEARRLLERLARTPAGRLTEEAAGAVRRLNRPANR